MINGFGENNDTNVSTPSDKVPVSEIENDNTALLPEEAHVSVTDKNEEFLINYLSSDEKWSRADVIVNDIFAYNVASNIINENIDSKPRSVQECRHRDNWSKWKDAI